MIIICLSNLILKVLIHIVTEVLICLIKIGILYRKQERNQEALEDFNKAIELDNNNSEAYNSRGNRFI